MPKAARSSSAGSAPVPFFKYHGLGNDFVLIDAIAQPALARRDWSALARAMCDRRLGVGADELLLLTRGPRAHHCSMRVFNTDGSAGGMCGNGIRCLARHMVERHAFAADALRVSVWDVGLRVVAIKRTRGAFAAAAVNMGPPEFEPRQVPCVASLARPRVDGERVVVEVPLPASLRSALGRAGESLTTMTALSMGNPHAVLWCPAPTRELIEQVGPIVQRSRLFPKSVNVHLARAVSRTHARMWTCERGSGVTLACGTGACAVLAAGVVSGRLSRAATITVPGGDLHVQWDETSGDITKAGPGALVFAGTYMPR